MVVGRGKGGEKMTEMPGSRGLTEKILADFEQHIGGAISSFDEDLERKIRELELAKVQQLAEEQGLKESSERLGIWLPRDQEEKPGSIPSEFYVVRFDQERMPTFKEHTVNFPIQDFAQLAVSVEALGVLYEVGPTYDVVNDGREGFMEFVSGLVEPKQPEV